MMVDGARPPWVIETTVEPRFAADADQLAGALAQMASADPTFGFSRDREPGAIVVMASGEAHLEAHLATLKRLYTGELRVGVARVRYREALAGAVDVDYTHKKQTGGTGEFARVRLRVEPNEPGAGATFQNETAGNVVPDEHIGGIEQGVRSVCDSGVLGGFPIDARVSLRDGAYHKVDSSWTAFEIAGRSAMRKAAEQAGVRLLEPVMDVEVEVPPECAGDVITDMYKRRIRIRDETRYGEGNVIRLDGVTLDLSTIVITGDARGDAMVIRGDAPLARLLGYAEALRSIGGGRASCTLCFSRYAQVQPDDAPDDFSPAAGKRPNRAAGGN